MPRRRRPPHVGAISSWTSCTGRAVRPLSTSPGAVVWVRHRDERVPLRSTDPAARRFAGSTPRPMRTLARQCGDRSDLMSASRAPQAAHPASSGREPPLFWVVVAWLQRGHPRPGAAGDIPVGECAAIRRLVGPAMTIASLPFQRPSGDGLGVVTAGNRSTY